MAQETARKDKRVYNYTKALKQPVWIQRLSDKISLPFAIKLSDISWTAFFTIVLMKLAVTLGRITPVPFAFWFLPALVTAFYLAVLVSDLTIDRKPFLRFIWDYIKFYWRYGRKASSYVINDGYFYRKQRLDKEDVHGFRK